MRVTVKSREKPQDGISVELQRKHEGLVSEFSPGKKGGDFELVFGGKLTVPPGGFGKKDVVTCCQVSPSTRYKYLPPLGPDDKLASEILILSTSAKRLKCTLTLTLPHVTVNSDFCDVVLYRRRVADEHWEICEHQPSDDGGSLLVHTDSAAIFAAASVPRSDVFPLPVAGCLYNSRLHRQVSVRLPKKSTDQDLTCEINILPLNKENLGALRRDFTQEMSDLVMASDIYRIQPNIEKEFRRPLTVKLPLPAGLAELPDLDPEDLAVMIYSLEGWTCLETNYKLAKNSISFDTKYLSKFCVALARPSRRRRLKEAFLHLEREQRVTRGEILPFLHVQEKTWTLWLDVVPTHAREDTINTRLQQGFRRITHSEIVPAEQPDSDENKVFIRRSWRHKRVPQPEVKERDDLDLVSGSFFDLELSGDLELVPTDPGRGFMGLHFHDLLKENYRKLEVRPLPALVTQQRPVKAVVKVFTTDGSTGERACVRTFDLEVEHEAVVDYYYVEPEPEPEEEVAEPEVVIETPPSPPPSPRKQEVKPTQAQRESWLRLTTQARTPKRVSRESKVLTGRSLLTLAREVEQGLTLAIYLDLNDSTITGMGFDALAKGQSLVDITYKVLMLWKRRSSRYKDKQVDMLAAALSEMGRRDVATVVLDTHAQNRELTAGCFDSREQSEGSV